MYGGELSVLTAAGEQRGRVWRARNRMQKHRFEKGGKEKQERETERRGRDVALPSCPVAWGENCSAADSGLSLFDNAPLLLLSL